MFHNILVPIDLSERGQPALAAAVELAAGASASLTLLHVIETLRDVPFEEIEEFYQSLRERAENVLAEHAAAFSGRVAGIREEIVFGRRAPEIVRWAEAHRCDLIVLASHRLDREQPMTSLGTLSHRVALLAPCAVLLVREPHPAAEDGE